MVNGRHTMSKTLIYATEALWLRPEKDIFSIETVKLLEHSLLLTQLKSIVVEHSLRVCNVMICRIVQY